MNHMNHMNHSIFFIWYAPCELDSPIWSVERFRNVCRSSKATVRVLSNWPLRVLSLKFKFRISKSWQALEKCSNLKSFDIKKLEFQKHWKFSFRSWPFDQTTHKNATDKSPATSWNLEFHANRKLEINLISAWGQCGFNGLPIATKR